MSNFDVIFLFAVFAVFTLTVVDIFWQRKIKVFSNTLPTLIFYIFLCYVLFKTYHRAISYQELSFENRFKMIKSLTYGGVVIHFVTLQLKSFKNKKLNQRIILFSFCNSVSLAFVFFYCIDIPLMVAEISLILAFIILIALFSFLVLSNAKLVKNLYKI